MKARRTWIEMNVAPWPHCFRGIPCPLARPSSWNFDGIDLSVPSSTGGARLEYRNGWTAVIFWNHDLYFADQIMLFDEMLELIDSRFGLKVKVNRVYVD
jgi:hypothetical protein